MTGKVAQGEGLIRNKVVLPRLTRVWWSSIGVDDSS